MRARALSFPGAHTTRFNGRWAEGDRLPCGRHNATDSADTPSHNPGKPVKLPRIRNVVFSILLLFALAYIAAALALALRDDAIAALEATPEQPRTIAIFGASGTAGDGILEAALADPGIDLIHVITRRATPRIDAGVASGKVRMTLHTDYLDYSAIHAQVANADAVFWAIGLSSLGVDEETYARIHVDFPARFVTEWLRVNDRPGITFHYISSSDISADSRSMWAREKFRAEQVLAALAEGTNLRVVFYRPDYIRPAADEAHLGQNLLYWFFAPVGAALEARQIGQAMLEVTARGDAFANGDRLSTRRIVLHSDAYERRRASESQ